MGHQIPFHTERYVVDDEALAGNSTDPHPVAFHICTAQGHDEALLSYVQRATVMAAEAGGNWSREVQTATVTALQVGRAGFVNTIEQVENLTVPAQLALKTGLIQALPKKRLPGQSVEVDDPSAPVVIKNGEDFAKVSGYVPMMAAYVAMSITRLTRTGRVDERFSEPPTGSSSEATRPTTPGSAADVDSTGVEAATAP